MRSVRFIHKKYVATIDDRGTHRGTKCIYFIYSDINKKNGDLWGKPERGQQCIFDLI